MKRTSTLSVFATTCAVLLALKGVAQISDLLAINVRHTRVQQLRHLGSVEPRLQSRFPCFEGQELVFDRQRGEPSLMA